MSNPNKLNDRLLEGYELKPTSDSHGKYGAQPASIPAPVMSNLVEGESYTVSDTPNKLVCNIFNSLKFMEDNNASTIGKIYIFASVIIFTVLFWMKQQFLANLPGLEVIFVAALINFIANYFLLNGALYKPFIDNENNSYLIKVTGGYAVGAIACFFYSLRYVELQTTLAIFYSSFFLVVLTEIQFFNETYKSNEIYLALGALVGSVITITSGSANFWVSTAPAEPNFLFGALYSLVSAVLMVMIMVNFGKMQTENFSTMNHVFSMMVVLFTPMFFPIQGVVTPTLSQWGGLVIFGVLTTAAVLFFIRSFQLESGARASVFIFLQIAFFYVIEFIMSNASGFSGVVGAVATIACVGMFSQQSVSKISVRESFAERERVRMQEMINMNRSE